MTTLRSIEEALIYITDCTLATVSSMAMKKSRTKGEYERQITIAQRSVDFLRGSVEALRAVPPKSRISEIITYYNGSVADWAKKYEQ